MDQAGQNLKKAEKGAQVSLAIYILISCLKCLAGVFFNAQSLLADGLNNFTDAISSVAVLIGLRSARKPADDDHRYGHWKAESIASLVTSLLMFVVATSVLQGSISSFFIGEKTTPDTLAAWVGVLSSVVIFALHQYNKRLAQKTQSHGLQAVAEDNLADSMTSAVTAGAIFASQWNLAWLDNVMALVVGLIILKTAYDIFKENIFELSDGFDEEKLALYRQAVETISGIDHVKTIRGRMYGNHIYLDLTMIVPDEMSVKAAHSLADQAEELLSEKYGVTHTHIHIAPLSQKDKHPDR